MMKYNFEQLNFAFKLDKWIAFNFGYETTKISQVDDQGSFSFRFNMSFRLMISG